MESKDVFFTWKDVKRLFLRKKKVYVNFFLVSFFSVFAFYLFQPPRYQATAVFKQAAQSRDQTDFIRSFLQSTSLIPLEAGAKSVFESRTLLKEVVESLGLQIQRPSSFVSFERIQKIIDSLRAEFGCAIPDRRLFCFSHVSSKTETISPFFLSFSTETSFEVLNAKKQKIAEGRVGSPVESSYVNFVLDQVLSEIKIGKLYAFQIHPWMDLVKKIRKNLEVKKSKVDQNVLMLSFLGPVAKTSSNVLNELMYFYQNHLKKENEAVSSLHMQYLEKRQSELLSKYEEALESHVAFLDESLETSGFMTLKQEVEVLGKPNEEYLNRLYDLDLQLSRLGSSKKEKKELKKKQEEVASHDVRTPFEKIYEKKERDFIETDLQEKRSFRGESRPIQKLLIFLGNKGSLEFKEDLSKDASATLLSGVEELKKICKAYLATKPDGDPLLFLEIQQKKQNLKAIAENELKKRREEKIFHELEGISPETVQKLYVEYNQQLDSLRVYTEQLLDVQGQILLPQFEITSLSGLLTDAVSQDMIQKASQRALELQDKANHSAKDVERIQSGLDVQKRFLLQHLEQVLSMQKLRMNLIEEKIISLQKTSVYQLSIEKELIQKQLVSLQERMKPLPEKWKRENELIMKRDLSLSMIEGLTELAESKNIQHQFFQVESKPIDLAFVPYKPFKRSAFSFSLIAAIFCTGFFFLKDFLKWLSKGKILTEDFAKASGITVCGFLRDGGESCFQNMCIEDKETLRKICAFLQGAPFEGRGLSASIISPNPLFFCKQVAALLAVRGLKVLLIECSAAPINRFPLQSGLYEYLSGQVEAPALLREKGFDYMIAGNYNGYFVEWLCRKEFKDLVQKKRLSYDLVLLSMQADLTDASLTPLKAVSDRSLFHVCEDVVWGEMFDLAEGDASSLAFVFGEGL